MPILIWIVVVITVITLDVIHEYNIYKKEFLMSMIPPPKRTIKEDLDLPEWIRADKKSKDKVNSLVIGILDLQIYLMAEIEKWTEIQNELVLTDEEVEKKNSAKHYIKAYKDVLDRVNNLEK